MLQSIARGTTTKDQVRALFRQSPQVEPVQNGEQWTYQSSRKLAGGNFIPGVGFTPETEERRIVVIVFDNQGIVADFTSYTEVH
jgi:outer membrane protein assembly factor BamE (lipoprotein component of BamABCDE complex)